MNKKLLMGLFLALMVAAFLSPLASSSPDGLERVAADLGFLEQGAGKNIISSPLPDYLFPGIANEAVATGVAGVTGTLLTFGGMYVLSKMLQSAKKPRNNH